MIERIAAYPDREMEIKFRIEGKVEKIAGGEFDAPHELQYPVPDLFQTRVSNF